MPHLSMNEAFFHLCQEVKNVAIHLAQTEHNLNYVAVRAVADECISSKECQGTIHVARYALHAYSESVTPEEKQWVI